MRAKVVADACQEDGWRFFAIFMVLLFFVAYYPGGMIIDSFDQLEQARSGWYHDWHPPFMAWLWHWMECFIRGSFGMLLMQGLGFAYAIKAIADSAFKNSKALSSWAVVLSFLLVPVSGVIGVIWKDAGTAVFMLLSVAALVKIDKSLPSLRWQCSSLAIAAMLIAMLFRHNAVIAVVPLVFCAVYSTGIYKKKRLLWLGGLGVILSLGLFVAVHEINALLTKTYRFPEQSIMVFDIAGIAVQSGRHDLVDELGRQVPKVVRGGDAIDFATVQKYYHPKTWNELVFLDDSPMQMIFDEGSARSLAQVWRAAILREPLAYFRHRLAVFGEVLAFTHDELFVPTHFQIPPGHPHFPYVQERFPDYAAAMPPGKFQGALQAAILSASQWGVWRPWLWLVPCIALTGVCFFFGRRWRALGTVVGLSGLASEFSLFFVAPGGDLRYSHWMFLAVWLMLMFCLADFIDRRSTSVAVAEE